MTKRRNNSKPVSELRRYECVPDATWGGFINVRLTEAQVQEFAAWYADNANLVPDVLLEVLADGIKLSAVYDTANQCVIVSFVGALTGSPAARYSVSSRAQTLNEAIALMVWKHCFVARGLYEYFSPRHETFNFG